MKIEERSVVDVTILDLKGKLLIAQGDELLYQKVSALVENGKIKIVLNMTDVSYVDSSGLGAIVRCHTTLNRNSGKLKLAGLAKRVRELISITQLDKVLDIHESVDAAVQSF